MDILNDPEFARLLTTLLYAIISGVVYSLIGYFKRSEGEEAFEGEQFFVSVIIGLIGGFVAFYLEISPQQAVAMILAETAILYYIENIAKAIWRRWIKPYLESLKAPTPTP